MYELCYEFVSHISNINLQKFGKRIFLPDYKMYCRQVLFIGIQFMILTEEKLFFVKTVYKVVYLFLFCSQLPPPFDQYKLVGVNVNPSTGSVDIHSESPYRSLPSVRPIERNGFHVSDM